jgi:lantibiotic modifying enzyme
MAWLHLASVLEDAALLKSCTAYAQPLINEDPGPVTDILGGAAGNGIYLLRLWEKTQDERFLQGAIRNGEWLATQALRGEAGIYWPFWVGKEKEDMYLGFAHGSSGTSTRRPRTSVGDSWPQMPWRPSPLRRNPTKAASTGLLA